MILLALVVLGFSLAAWDALALAQGYKGAPADPAPSPIYSLSMSLNCPVVSPGKLDGWVTVTFTATDVAFGPADSGATATVNASASYSSYNFAGTAVSGTLDLFSNIQATPGVSGGTGTVTAIATGSSTFPVPIHPGPSPGTLQILYWVGGVKSTLNEPLPNC